MAYIGNSQFRGVGVVTGGNIQDGSIESIDLATLTNIDVNGGSIDGAIIGANEAVAGNFSDLSADSLGLGNGSTISYNNTESRIEVNTHTRVTGVLEALGNGVHPFSWGNTEEHARMSYSATSATIISRPSYDLVLGAAGNPLLYLDTNGNVGINQTPPAGAEIFDYLYLNSMSINGIATEGGLFRNSYYNGPSYKALKDGSSSRMYMANDGAFLFEQAPTALADQPIAYETKMKLTGEGDLGIGTDNPVAKLHVWNPNGGNATDKATMLSEAVVKLQPHSTNSTNLLVAQVNSGNGMGLQVTNSSATANWDLALSPFGGNVGIGTDDPLKGRLHIRGSNYTLTSSGQARGGIHINADSNPASGGYANGISFGYSSGSSAIVGCHTSTSSDSDVMGLAFITHPSSTGGIDGAEKMRLTHDGNLLVGAGGSIWGTSGRGVIETTGSASALNGLVAGNNRAYTFLNGVDLDLWNEANGALSLATNNQPRLRITNTGNVGINTTAPLARLDVKGTSLVQRAHEDISLTSDSFGSTGDAGEITLVLQVNGTIPANCVLEFTYAASTWKSWMIEVTVSNTMGFAHYVGGGYNNGGISGYLTEVADPNNNITSAAINTYSNQGNKYTFGLREGGIHTTIKIKYAQGGGDGAPRADRCFVNVGGV